MPVIPCTVRGFRALACKTARFYAKMTASVIPPFRRTQALARLLPTQSVAKCLAPDTPERSDQFRLTAERVDDTGY
jgi:hypothetical protein